MSKKQLPIKKQSTFAESSVAKRGGTAPANVPVTKEGSLIKRGGSHGGVKNWKPRNFRLVGNTLYYYEGSPGVGKEARGHIPLVGCDVVRCGKENGGRSHSFNILSRTQPDKTPFFMQAKDAAESDDWIDKISKATKGGPGAVFGAPLQDLAARNDSANGVPWLVDELLKYLRTDAVLKNEGIFRIPGDDVEVKTIRACFDAGDPNAAELVAKCDNPYSIGGLLKLFYRELPEPLCTFALYDKLVAASKAVGPAESASDLSPLTDVLLKELNPVNRINLEYLIRFLCEVASFTADNKMTVANVAVVFAPNLLRPEVEGIQQLQDMNHVCNTFAILMVHCNAIFGTPKAEQEGPTCDSDDADSIAEEPPEAPEGVQGVAAAMEGATLQDPSPETSASEVAGTQEAVAQMPPAPVEVNEWFFLTPDQQQHGPYPLSMMCQMAAQGGGTMHPETYTFRAGMETWKKVCDLGSEGDEAKIRAAMGIQ